jgi:nitroreductase
MDPTRPVEREMLLEILEDANWAPTHGLTEPWRFHIYQGDARQTLAKEMQRLYREVTPAAEYREDKYQKLAVNPLLAPVLILVWMHRDGGGKIPEIEELAATSCAIQNILLSATTHGLASFWSSPPLIYNPAFNQWLNIREQDRALGLIYLGWPKPNTPIPKSTRKPVAEKITWHS